MSAFWQVFLASVKDLIRERMNLFWFLGFPIIFMLIFGMIFSGNGNVNYDVGLAYDSEGPLVDALSAGLSAVSAFTLHKGSHDDEVGELKKVEFMPSFLRPAMAAMPLTYLGDLLRQVMVGAPPTYATSTDLIVLGGWTVVTLVLAARLWKWE